MATQQGIDQRHMSCIIDSLFNLGWEGWKGGTLLELFDEAEDCAGYWVAWGVWSDSELRQAVPALSLWQ